MAVGPWAKLGAIGRHLLLGSLLLLLGACDRNPTSDAVTLWAHAGQEAERAVLRSQVSRFNRRHPETPVQLTFIPEGSYNAQVQAAAAAGDLPDILELDGPFVARYAWQGVLQPLDELIPRTLWRQQLPSLRNQVTYAGRRYAVGVFDSGLGLFARASALERVGARLPTQAARAWSLEEFEALLRRLAAEDEDGAVLDLKLNYAGEWYSYAFSPLLWSAGGGLIADAKAEGLLNGPASVRALRRLQHWIESGWVDPNLDDQAFVSGRVSLAWGGHWNYADYAAAWGTDLRLLPLPDMGQGSRTGQGSWCWAISRRARHPEVAARFLAFLLGTEEVLAMTAANGAVPGTEAAIARSELYGPQGALRLFARQLRDGTARPRPRTPAYPMITSAFQEAVERIRSGTAPQLALDRAVQLIDQDLRDNRGYPPSRP